jgi:hypothetical protein
MPGKRMLILPEEVVKKIEDNRGDLSQADFLDFVIEEQLKQTEARSNVGRKELEDLRCELQHLVTREKKLATKEELQALNDDTRRLLKSFIDFFMKYGIELGEKASVFDLKDVIGHPDFKDLPGDEGGREVKIKYK